MLTQEAESQPDEGEHDRVGEETQSVKGKGIHAVASPRLRHQFVNVPNFSFGSVFMPPSPN